MEPAFAWTLGTALFTGGVAFGGVKVALNGTRERVRGLERDTKHYKELNNKAHNELGERLASIETKVDVVIDYIVEGTSKRHG